MKVQLVLLAILIGFIVALPFRQSLVFGVGTPDAYGNRIATLSAYQNSTGTFVTYSWVTYGTYVTGYNMSLAVQHTILRVEVRLNYTQGGATIAIAQTRAAVYVNISGVVTNGTSLFASGYEYNSYGDHYWDLFYDYPSVMPAVTSTWFPATSTSYNVTVLCQAYYSGTWNDAESWDVKMNTPVTSTYLYSYTLRGPYLESGTIYNGLVYATLYYANSSTASLSFNGTSGYEESFLLQSNVSASYLIWNITSDYNHSRIYTFKPTEYTVDYTIYVPNTTDQVGQYSIIIADLVGVSNMMVETDVNIGGSLEPIERQTYVAANPMGFYLIMFHHYTLKAVADQGTFTWDLIADGYSPKSFNITSVPTPAFKNITLSATRLNGTALNVFYYDYNHTTTWINTTVLSVNTTGYYFHYSQNDSGYTQNYTLNTLESATSYVAQFLANVNGTLTTWQMPVYSINETNFWSGKFDMLGDFPFAIENAVAALICLGFVALGGYSDTEWWLAVAVLLAALFVYIGWLTVPYAGITGALMVVVFMYFYKTRSR